LDYGNIYKLQNNKIAFICYKLIFYILVTKRIFTKPN